MKTLIAVTLALIAGMAQDDKQNLEKEKAQWEEMLAKLRGTVTETDKMLEMNRVREKIWNARAGEFHERHKKAQELLERLEKGQMQNAADIEDLGKQSEEARWKAFDAAEELLVESTLSLIKEGIAAKLEERAAIREKMAKMADTVLNNYTDKKMLAKYGKILQAHLDVLTKIESIIAASKATSALKSQLGVHEALERKDFTALEKWSKAVKEESEAISGSTKAAKESLKLISAMRNDRELMDFLKNSEVADFLKQFESTMKLFKAADLIVFADHYTDAMAEFGSSWIDILRLSSDIENNNESIKRIGKMIRDTVAEEQSAAAKRDQLSSRMKGIKERRDQISKRIAEIERRIAEIDALLAAMQ